MEIQYIIYYINKTLIDIICCLQVLYVDIIEMPSTYTSK